MNEQTPINLNDYMAPLFLIQETKLKFEIKKEYTIVTSHLEMRRSGKHLHSLILDGVNLELLSVSINGEKLAPEDYILSLEKLEIKSVPDKFIFSCEVKIDPAHNFSCEGLYKSGAIFCTQNEPEGFRKITYFLDRPDVMSKFTTEIIANKKDFPLLLANGNKAALENCGKENHKITWIDPHPKPSYLFAIVAGDLSLVKDSFTTMSGKKVDLEIYVDHGNEEKCEHAMTSLKNSMKWDEDTFGLEYDLDLYMIVAVDSFNMGAMENKGLNIFNSAYVLANDKSATDNAFQGIEAVIGHEYFHNWTGNRVTCRDWFQLTLKEGLTVFRDQEFSSDMLSRNVKRIQDVNTLRAHQFSEDSGPFSHPIKPKSYIEINNFYTATVYEKGAEVIRMIHTLIGKDSFRKGMDLYFSRFDGMAVTTQDFVQAMSDASGMNLDHFKVWYDQNGTPEVFVTKKYDTDKKELTLTFKHSTQLNNEDYDSLFFPFSLGLVGSNGEQYQGKTNLIINQTEQEFTFTGVEFDPILSLNRNFSAPVNVHYDYSDDDLYTLLENDTDGFSRFDAARSLIYKQLHRLIESLKSNTQYNIDQRLFDGLRGVLSDKSLEDSYKSLFFELPSQLEVNEKLELFDVENVYEALKRLKKQLASQLVSSFADTYTSLMNYPYSLKADSMGARQLKNICLSYLLLADDKYFEHAKKQFESAGNMTDEISALTSLYHSHAQPEIFMNNFYEKWKGTTLVMQMWIGMQASHSEITISDLEKLQLLPVFDAKVPNLLRALYGNFHRNTYAFNNSDGSGYEFLGKKIIDIDQYNPSVAARLAKSFNHINHLDSKRKELVKTTLDFMLNHKLSNDTYEIIKTTLA